jgi:hypothetical protein
MEIPMVPIISVAAILLAGSIAAEDHSGSTRFDIAKVRPVVRQGALCFKKGEVISGMNKICYYDCLGSEAAITIRAIDLCPLNIRQ